MRNAKVKGKREQLTDNREQIIKHDFLRFLFIFSFFFILLFSCSNQFDADLGGASLAKGFGRIVIGEDEQARTLFPRTPEFVSYTINFEWLGEGETGRESQTVTALPFSVELLAGPWLITVVAFTRLEGVEGMTDGNYRAATGNRTVTVVSGQSVPVTVNLTTETGQGQGVFEYDIGLPQGLGAAVLRILYMDRTVATTVNLLETASGRMALDTGFYIVQIQITSGRVRSRTELIHIYNGHTTTAAGSAWNFDLEEGVYLSVGELGGFLANAPQNTADNPYPVKLMVNLESLGVTRTYPPSEMIYVNVLGTLTEALHGKYVNLDLSNATGNLLTNNATGGSYSYMPETNRDRIVSIILPEGLTYIPEITFISLISLKEIVFPDSLQTIGTNAFNYCTSLKEIILPNSVQIIGDHAFRDCTSLKEIILPASLEIIGRYTFAGCIRIEKIDLPLALRRINDGAFNGCTSLKEVVLPASVEAIGGFLNNSDAGAFQGCTSLESITLPASLTTIGFRAFLGCTSLKEIILPDSLQTIADWAFGNCTSLEKIIIPDSLQTIGANVFRDCTSLEKVELPASVETISVSAFENCTNLLLNIPANSTLRTIGANAFRGVNQFRTTMDFSGLVQLTSIDLTGYTELQYLNLSGCIRLTSVNTTGLTLLREIDLSDTNALSAANIRIIGNPILEKVILRSNIGTVPSTMFSDTPALSGIYFGGLQTSVSFNLTALSWLRYIDLSPMTALTTLSGGITALPLVENVILPESLITINGPVFRGFTSLKVLPIMPGIQSITNSAFEGCTGLYADTGTLDLSAYTTLISIGDNAFRNCTQITSFILPVSLEYLGRAFNGINNLNNGITVLDLSYLISLKTIQGTFAHYGNLHTVILPEGLEHIGDEAFLNCVALTTIDLPKSLISIGNSAFRIPYSLSTPFSTIDFSKCSSLVNIGDSAFENRFSTTLDFSGLIALKTIGNSAFRECRFLLSMNFSGLTALETIGSDAFISTSNRNIGTLDLSGLSALKSIGNNAFRRLGITMLNLSDLSTLESIGNNAFAFNALNSIGPGPQYSVNISGLNNLIYLSGFSDMNLVSVDLSGLPSLQIIGTGAFAATPLTSINLSANTNLTTIGGSAFSQTPLTAIDLSNNTALTSIADSAFNNNANFNSIGPGSQYSVNIQGLNNLVSISGFRNNSNLTSVNLSELSALEIIDNNAFLGCANLTAFDLSGIYVPPQLGNNFPNNQNMLIYVPAESLEVYRTAPGWNNFASRIHAKP
ncbi:MAG: leucine-rich repeat domain-containing protein [Treponema sp.]|jgi:hypothetical protein|nr:leucine-rich repeat domain-containing protein [Treponema sp.]